MCVFMIGLLFFVVGLRRVQDVHDRLAQFADRVVVPPKLMELSITFCIRKKTW